MSSWENKEWDEMTNEEKQACEEDAAAGLEELFNEIANKPEPEEEHYDLGSLFGDPDPEDKRSDDEIWNDIDRKWAEYEAQNKKLSQKIEFEVEKKPEIPQSLGPFDNINDIVEEPKHVEEPEEPEFKRVRSSWGAPVFVRDIYRGN